MDRLFETAEPHVQRMLQQNFETPVCTVVVDSDGKELKRTISANPLAALTVGKGSVANARIFRAPFPSDEKKWQAPCEIPIGVGQCVKGDLLYEVRDESPVSIKNPANATYVVVAGELTGAGKVGSSEVQNAKHRVKGFQFYDKRLKDWISGEFSIRTSSEILESGFKFPLSGTMIIRMKMLSAEKFP